MHAPSPSCLRDRSESWLAPALGAALLLIALLAPALGCGSGAPSSASQPDLAQPIASANGPQLGYIWFDVDKTLRPILGLPGSSQIGQSIVPTDVYERAVVSATASIAVLQATDGSFDVMRLPSGQPVSLNLALPPGAQMRLSPSATSALVYTPGSSSASLISNLQSTPLIEQLSTPKPIADAAVSDSAGVGFEYVHGSSVAIAIKPFGGSLTPVLAIGATGGLSFLPGRDDLLAADASANTLTLIRTTSNVPSIQLVPTAGLLKAPIALGVSNSGRWAIVANSSEQSLVRVDLATLVSTSIPCSCKPTLAEPLADDGAFRVTALPAGPNWLVDTHAASPKPMFIPALRGLGKTAVVVSAVKP